MNDLMDVLRKIDDTNTTPDQAMDAVNEYLGIDSSQLKYTMSCIAFGISKTADMEMTAANRCLRYAEELQTLYPGGGWDKTVDNWKHRVKGHPIRGW